MSNGNGVDPFIATGIADCRAVETAILSLRSHLPEMVEELRAVDKALVAAGVRGNGAVRRINSDNLPSILAAVRDLNERLQLAALLGATAAG
jgi:hypothetical protein